MNKISLLKVLKQFNSIDEKIDCIKKLTERDILNHYCSSELHCIEVISSIENANVTKISKKLSMTRGAISKITKKLIEKGAIVSYQNGTNKKEIYFRLTDIGEQLNEEHRQWHVDWEERSTLYFNDWSKEDLDVVFSFLETYRSYLDFKIKKIKEKKK